jgi:hypothetical protein
MVFYFFISDYNGWFIVLNGFLKIGLPVSYCTNFLNGEFSNTWIFLSNNIFKILQ